jgi:hypothetical protein
MERRTIAVELGMYAQVDLNLIKYNKLNLILSNGMGN